MTFIGMKNISTKTQKFQKRATPIGKKFSHLEVLSRNGTRTDGKPLWECQCTCGKVVTVISYNVIAGRTISCGCQNRNRKFSVSEHHGFDSKTPEYGLWTKARARAKRIASKTNTPFEVLFNITPNHISIPILCPVLGIPLFKGTLHHHNNSPSLDRKIPSLGYIPNNIQVISHRANALKNNATVEELELVLAHIRQVVTV
jgi:hypothetical protein